MKATLIFPPATDPRAPHLALAALAAALRPNGIEVVLRDLDIDSLQALVRPDPLAAAIGRFRAGAGAHVDPDRRTALLRLSDGLVERMEEAWRVIHDPVRFYDPNDFGAGRATLGTALAIVSAAAPVPVDYSLDPIRYDVAGCDARRLRDLLRVTRSPEANLFRAYWEAELLPSLNAGDQDLVGISLANRQQLIPGLCLARLLKEQGHLVVLGGSLITKFAAGLPRWPEFFEAFADAVVVFEGETALLELLRQLERGRAFSRVPNLLYFEHGQVRVTATHVEDINALATPDFAGLPLDKYLAPQPVLPLLFGKGCYHSGCAFCDIPHTSRFAQPRHRRRAADTVVADVRRLDERFGARHFVITDEALSPRVLCDVADRLGDAAGRYSFTGYARLEPGFTPEVCRKVASAGVRKLFFGLESAAQRTLDHMAKGTQASVAPAVLRACHEAGIRFHLFSMIGLPEEDEASARETLAFLLDHRDIIDHPGNSFDVHPFGLDVRAAYFANRDRFGLSIEPGVFEQEFAISLSPLDWENTRGLSAARVRDLLGEFHAALDRVYRRHHHAPPHLWPPFEEYAVLYGDRYLARAFPCATELPDAADDRRFRLRFSPACAIRQGDGAVSLTCNGHTVDLPLALARGLTAPRERTVAELVSECVSVRANEVARAESLIRALTWDLFGKGILQLYWADGADDTQRLEACT